MATWSFNSTGAGGYTPLVPYNSGMAQLAPKGNAINVAVGPILTSEVSASPPGASWTSKRSTGNKLQVVEWAWMIVALDETNLNAVQVAIKRYVSACREFTLTNGTSSTPWALLSKDGTQPVGNPRLIQAGYYLREWRLRFEILRPSEGTFL